MSGRIVDTATLGTRPGEYRIIFSVAEQAAIAGRLGLQALQWRAVELTVQARRGGRLVEVAGRIVADVVQTCVVSLEPVPAAIDQSFSVLYAPGRAPAQDRVVDVAPLGDDAPEPLEGSEIDLGEVAVEQFALVLEPWPRLPDAKPPAWGGGDGAGAEAEAGNAFGALARLRERQ